MIPYPYNMVDMGGIDLAEANGTIVEGLYSKIVEAVNACGDVVLYNWKFASIEIAPQHTQILVGETFVLINSVIQVTELDEVSIIGLDPPVPVGGIVPLEATENRVYTAVPPVDGFNPVNVVVPIKVLVPLSVSENGDYDPSDYNADGFSAVTVSVESPLGTKAAIHIWTQSKGSSDASINVQIGTFDGSFTPSAEVVNIPYASIPQYVNYGIVDIEYSNLRWHLRAATAVSYIANSYATNQIVKEWRYDATDDMLIIEA